MKTLSVEFKEELKDVVEKYVNEFERVEFRKNEAEQETELDYCNGRVFYKNEDLTRHLFDFGCGYEYDVFIHYFKKFKANGYKGEIGYYKWIEDEIKKNIDVLDDIIHRYDNIIHKYDNRMIEIEKENIEEELLLLFYSSGLDYKGFYNDDSSKLYTTEEVIDIVLDVMTKDTSIIEEFVSDYYDTDYDLNKLIKIGKEHGLFADLSYDVEKDD